MSAKVYKAQRELRGTQTEVAQKLGVHQVTIARRETGILPITKEAWLALCALPKKRKGDWRKKLPKEDWRRLMPE